MPHTDWRRSKKDPRPVQSGRGLARFGPEPGTGPVLTLIIRASADVVSPVEREEDRCIA